MLREKYKNLIDCIAGTARAADDLRRDLENLPPAENQPIHLATGVARLRDLLRILHKYELFRHDTWKQADDDLTRRGIMKPEEGDQAPIIF